jgi:peptidylprolyl isomerase
MKHIVVILLMAAGTAAASAQSAAEPAATAKTVKSMSSVPEILLPPGIPSASGPRESIFVLQYQDIKIGDGAVAEPGKLYKVQYTYWLAADGKKIDSTYDHPGPPLKDASGNLLLGADGKPKDGPPLTVNFIQGRHAMIMGFDDGFEGMRIGGKRRLFIPWQMAYGPMGHPPAIPPKADMIYDVELVDVAEPAAPPVQRSIARPPIRPLPLGMGSKPTGSPDAAPKPPAPPQPPSQ